MRPTLSGKLANAMREQLVGNADIWSLRKVLNNSKRTATRLAAGVLSCCAVLPAVRAETNAPANSVTIPIKIRHGDLLVETRINGSEPMEFKVDSGFGISII